MYTIENLEQKVIEIFSNLKKNKEIEKWLETPFEKNKNRTSFFKMAKPNRRSPEKFDCFKKVSDRNLGQTRCASPINPRQNL